jgi:hypothetical protein
VDSGEAITKPLAKGGSYPAVINIEGRPAILKIWELISIVLSALVGGMYWEPWLALSKSLNTFKLEVFLDIVDRMNRNMRPLMIVLAPIALLSIVPFLFISFSQQPTTFGLNLAGFPYTSLPSS